MLERVAIPYSRISSQSRHQTVSPASPAFFTDFLLLSHGGSPSYEKKNTAMASLTAGDVKR